MQTNNKWEEEFDKLVPQTTDELLDGDIEETEPTQFGYKIVDNTHKIVHIHTITDWQGIKNFISKIEQEAYNRGKEEGLGEQLSKTKSITTKYEIPAIILEEFKKKTNQETLEKVKEKIKCGDIAWTVFNGKNYINEEDLLKELNNIK